MLKMSVCVHVMKNRHLVYNFCSVDAKVNFCFYFGLVCFKQEN